MVEITLGVWPGIAAALTAILAVYIRLWQPEPKHNAAWFMAFGLLGLTAIAATITLQVILYQQRQDQRRMEAARDNQISEVKGQMAALLALVPSLKSGNPDETVAAVRQAAEIESHLATLQEDLNRLREADTPRSVSANAERALIEELRVLGQPETINIAYDGRCNDCPELASTFLRVFTDAGWTAPPYRADPFIGPGLWLSSDSEGDDDSAQRVRILIGSITGLPCQYLRHQGKGFRMRIGSREPQR